ncbi:hypothetical protein [Paenibacillus harenae]|uniref:hypothetical protein n=1 Tax=Paenibacillus harenae TaxID=306543 RepID=UPI00278EFDFF|nr:hypothetical protein [Paenibacillus harenae]MDQ0059584.1 putative membrane protein [Paenibacillus harenae]
MSDRFKSILWLILYSLAAGVLLAAFSFTPGIWKYMFSLLALYLGIRFFRKYDSIGLRIAFFAVAILFYLLAAVIISIVTYMRDNPDIFNNV